MKRTPLKRKTPLKPRSDKTAAKYVDRRAFVADQLRRRPCCEFPLRCWNRAVDIHEPLLRSRGGSILDPENTVALCREHHDWVHANPAKATELGLMKSAYPQGET